jgi:hypothetical protein
LRPETVRALVVHSAEWTATMRQHIDRAPTKGEIGGLIRRYGMGVPDVDRAVRSATDALTLISEATIRPYERDGNSSAGRAREMNLHELPWPRSVLSDMGGPPYGSG